MSEQRNSYFMEGTKVTVALAVLNGAPFLELALRSVLNQSWTNWELLLIDDGSTDGAIERLPFLNDPRIILIRDGRNRGLSFRLNQAIQMASGKYFARMDHDDICHPDRFTCQVNYLVEHPEVDLLATKCYSMDEQNKLIGTLPSAIKHVDICRLPWKGFYMPHPSWMGRTEWFRQNNYLSPAPYCCEDQELLLRAHYTSCYSTHPNYLLAYRAHSSIPWLKQFRTRVAMAKMQFNHFIVRREFINAVLSLICLFIRISNDTWKKVSYIFLPPSKKETLSSEADIEWEILIKKLSSSTVYTNSNEVNNVQS